MLCCGYLSEIQNFMNMNKRIFESRLKKANKAESEFQSACDALAMIFQPYIPYDIAVLYQQSDGFVIEWEHSNDCAPENEGVMEAFENIKKDKNYYK